MLYRTSKNKTKFSNLYSWTKVNKFVISKNFKSLIFFFVSLFFCYEKVWFVRFVNILILFIFSRSGKSTLCRELLVEKNLQFENELEQLIYIYNQDDENINTLKEQWGKKGKFLTEIPMDLPEKLIPSKSCAVLDDLEDTLINDKEKQKLLKSMANVLIHHKKLVILITLQSYDIFYKRHPLNGCLQQATKLILFKSVNNFGSLKRWLNSYAVKLKAKQKLFDVYEYLVSSSAYNYVVIDLDQSMNNPLVYTNILYSDSRPFIVFNVEPCDPY